MKQRPIEERMSELQQRIEALRRTRQQLEARQAAALRKRQERRRYLLGSFLLERLSQDGPLRELVRHELPLFLKEERDRQLFAELLAGQGGNGEARISATSSDAVSTEDSTSPGVADVERERHDAE